MEIPMYFFALTSHKSMLFEYMANLKREGWEGGGSARSTCILPEFPLIMTFCLMHPPVVPFIEVSIAGSCNKSDCSDDNIPFSPLKSEDHANGECFHENMSFPSIWSLRRKHKKYWFSVKRHISMHYLDLPPREPWNYMSRNNVNLYKYLLAYFDEADKYKYRIVFHM